MPPVSALPSVRQRRKEARPQELLEAALELFVEKGFAATRSEEVASRAGVSKGTLYLYFPSKEDLFKAVVRSNLSNLIAEGGQMLDAFEGSTADLLRCLLGTWWGRMCQTTAGGIAKVVMAEARNFPDLAKFYVDEVIVPAHRLIGRALQRGIDRGEFRPVPIDETVLALVAPSLFMAMQRHSFGACPICTDPVDPMRVFDAQIDLMLRGLERGEAPKYNEKLPAAPAGQE